MDAFKLFKNYRKIKTQIKGRGSYTLWISDNHKKRSVGLSNVKKLPRRHGMLFIYDEAVKTPFTMKNTSIPLEIIFLDRYFNVVDHFKCRPFEKRSIQPKSNYRYVIEI